MIIFIQFNTGSCCEHITVSTNIYLYACVSLLAPVRAVCVCVCVCVCVVSNQNTSKKAHYRSDLSKLDPLLHKTHSKAFLILRYQSSTCDISFRKATNQVWLDHLLI